MSLSLMNILKRDEVGNVHEREEGLSFFFSLIGLKAIVIMRDIQIFLLVCYNSLNLHAHVLFHQS